MSKRITRSEPQRFGLATFADLLPTRDPIIGEDPGSFAGFREGIVQSLLPFTPYECVIAENLIAIEWELLQHRRMRDATLRSEIRTALRRAMVESAELQHHSDMEPLYQKFMADGGKDSDWEDPFPFDIRAAEIHAAELAKKATSHDLKLQSEAQLRMLELGFDPVQFMSEAYCGLESAVGMHDNKIQELERRRREVKRDYDALQRTRPVEGEIVVV